MSEEVIFNINEEMYKTLVEWQEKVELEDIPQSEIELTLQSATKQPTELSSLEEEKSDNQAS